MKVDYSKDFEKSLKKLSGKMLESVRRVIKEFKEAEDIKDITDCKKLIGYRSIYRIRIGVSLTESSVHLYCCTY